MLKRVMLLVFSIALIVSVGGCGKKAAVVKEKSKVNNGSAHHGVSKVYIDTKVPLDKTIAENIKSECVLDKRLVDNIQTVGAKQNIEVVLNEKAGANENTLKLEIIDAISAGNAFIGHRKYVVVRGELYEGNKKVASFKSARLSGGGFFGGYKSSCAVLGRCTVAIAQDIVQWLKSPTQNAMLGDKHLIK